MSSNGKHTGTNRNAKEIMYIILNEHGLFKIIVIHLIIMYFMNCENINKIRSSLHLLL